ncbi:MAG: hypothetical protein ISN29_06605 [Gammaproteobacteria bacterium AqS3]|nr:hypothetical protein [Gammaproteobacteria bacterium AqS3]
MQFFAISALMPRMNFSEQQTSPERSDEMTQKPENVLSFPSLIPTMPPARLPCVEGVTKPSSGAASVFLVFVATTAVIFFLQLALTMRSLYRIGSPRQDVVATVSQNHQIALLLEPQTDPLFSPAPVLPNFYRLDGIRFDDGTLAG